MCKTKIWFVLQVKLLAIITYSDGRECICKYHHISYLKVSLVKHAVFSETLGWDLWNNLLQ